MNPLSRYFEAEAAETPTRLAQRIGRAPSTITRVLKAERRPSLDLAKAIEAGTGGEVTAAELVTFFLARPAPGPGDAPTPGAGGRPPKGDARERPDLLPGPLRASPAYAVPGEPGASGAAPQSRHCAASPPSSIAASSPGPVAKERQPP